MRITRKWLDARVLAVWDSGVSHAHTLAVLRRLVLALARQSERRGDVIDHLRLTVQECGDDLTEGEKRMIANDNAAVDRALAALKGEADAD